MNTINKYFLILIVLTLFIFGCKKRGSEGLAFNLIEGGTAYEVKKGSVSDSQVIIPRIYNKMPVVRIADNGFQGGLLSDIIIPKSVTSIGNSAFEDCPYLWIVNIPKNIDSIGSRAFANCPSMRSIKIDNPETYVDDSAFYRTPLRSINGIELKDIGSEGAAGGIIFHYTYKNGNVIYYEVAPARSEIGVQWGAKGARLRSSTDTIIGSGKSNTEKLIQMFREVGEVNNAAQIAAAQSINGFTDWFLPSFDELKLMYDNLKLNNIGDFKDELYWSSSTEETTTYQFNFRDGSYYNDADRHLPCVVRAIRTSVPQTTTTSTATTIAESKEIKIKIINETDDDLIVLMIKQANLSEWQMQWDEYLFDSNLKPETSMELPLKPHYNSDVLYDIRLWDKDRYTAYERTITITPDMELVITWEDLDRSQNNHFFVKNETNKDLTKLYLKRIHSEEWGEEMLKGKVIGKGSLFKCRVSWFGYTDDECDIKVIDKDKNIYISYNKMAFELPYIEITQDNLNDGKDVHFYIINNMNYDMEYVYIKPSWSDEWDIPLHRGLFSVNQQLRLIMPKSYPEKRLYDIRLRDSAGDYLIRKNVQINKATEVHFTISHYDQEMNNNIIYQIQNSTGFTGEQVYVKRSSDDESTWVLIFNNDLLNEYYIIKCILLFPFDVNMEYDFKMRVSGRNGIYHKKNVKSTTGMTVVFKDEDFTTTQ